MPEIGATKTFPNGNTGRWDGMGWELVPAAASTPDAPLSSEPDAEPVSTGERFAEGLWRNLNPMGLVKAAAHPIDTLGAIIDAHASEFDKARTAYKEGRYSEAVGHLTASGLPVLGPAAAHAGERIGEGDIAGGVGEGVGLIGGAIGGPRLVQGARNRLPSPARVAGRVKDAAAVAAKANPDLAADLAGVASPRVGNAMRAAQQAREILARRGQIKPEVAPPAAAPMPPAAAPVAAPEATAPPVTVQPAQASVAAPAPTSAAGTVGLPMAQRTAGQQSGAWLGNDVALAARRLGVTLTPKDNAAIVAAIKKTGQSPLEAVQALAQMAAKPGVMTTPAVDAEIAARVGNRSPYRP